MDGKQLQLQPRLRMLADLVPAGAGLADVGTDHGYLPVRLLQEGRISRAIASDINPAPLEHARRTAAKYGVGDRMDFRLCAGLDAVGAEEADAIVIAGMGGETIISILQAAPWTRRPGLTLLLQPMTKAENLRIWLADNGYTFIGERLASDKGHLYPILLATGGEREKLTPAEACGGVLLEGDPLWGQYLDRQMRRARRRIEGLEHAGRTDAAAEIERLEDLYRALEERKERIV